MDNLFFVFAIIIVSVVISLILFASICAAGFDAPVTSFAAICGIVTPLTFYGFKNHEF